jgi:hypothetical protein
MRLGFAAVVLFASCGFPHGQPGNNGDDAGPRDAADGAVDMMIDAPMSIIDAPPDMAVPTDSDGDGVLDPSDNCPTMANTNQRDHDADGNGDVCDRCPHLANATDPDGDSDGVGDACDPRPTTGGDSRVFFEGFYDTNAIAGWTETGNGNWFVSNGVLTQSSSSTSFTTHTLQPPGNWPRAAITAGVRVIALGNATGGFDTPHVSVATGIANNQSYWCSVVDEGNSDKVYASIFRPNMSPDYPSMPWTGQFTTNSELRITSALIGTTNVATAVQTTPSAVSVTAMGNIGSPAGSVQVATRTAAASFDYIFIVSVGN